MNDERSEPLRVVELKNGKKAFIREAIMEDAEELVNIGLSVMEEGRFMVSTPEEFKVTVEEEKVWIQEHRNNPGFALFIAEVDGKSAGMINFENGAKKSIEHRGMLGISIKKSYRGIGIGQALMQTLLDWAEKNPLIQKVSLAVFANNEPAIRLYKQFGFQVEGRRLKEIRQPDSRFIDDLLMYRFVSNA